MNNHRHWMSSLWEFSKGSQLRLLCSTLLSILSVFAGLIPYWAIYRLILQIIEGARSSNEIKIYIVIAVSAYIIQIISFGASTVLSHVSAYHILSQIRVRLAQKLMRLPLGVIESKSIGELKSLFVDKVEKIELPLAHLIPEVIGNLLLSLAIFISMIIIDWRIALALLITLPLSLFAFQRLMSGFDATYDNQVKSSNYMNSSIVEYIEGIEVIKTFNQSQTSYQKYRDAVHNYKTHTLNWFRDTWGYMSLCLSLLPSTFVGVLPMGMYLVSVHQLNNAQFFLCLVLSLGVVAPIRNFTNYINQIKSIQYAILDVTTILEIDELPESKQPSLPQIKDIIFKDVGFSYHNTEQDMIFNHLSFEIPERAYTALVGPSGSGKSTVAKLLLRFWDTTRGDIYIGGVNIKDISPKDLNELIRFVDQDNFLLNLSFKDNIKLGKPEATDEEVIHAAKLAYCHDFISVLPEGYDTVVGSVGDKLSGGEKQRVTIARMLLKDAPIVILDEATAYIDPGSEQQIQQAIASLTHNKTLIVIAHRLSTIKNADQILVIGEKQLLEKGTHKALIEQKGLYHHMWQTHIDSRNWGVSS